MEHPKQRMNGNSNMDRGIVFFVDLLYFECPSVNPFVLEKRPPVDRQFPQDEFVRKPSISGFSPPGTPRIPDHQCPFCLRPSRGVLDSHAVIITNGNNCMTAEDFLT